MTISLYLRHRELDSVYGSGNPAITYWQLHDGDPGSAGTNNVIAGVARAALTNNDTNFPDASSSQKLNGAEIDWGSTGGQNSLPDATHISGWSASSGGNLLDYGALDAPFDIADREKISIPAGDLSIQRA